MTNLPLGERLVGQERRLCLLCVHLSGRAVRARVELDDLVQEVFVRALAKPDGVPPFEPGEAALWRFLSVLARHVVIDVARAVRASKRGAVEDAPGPHTAAAAGESGRMLASAFLALSPEHRRVLGLRQFEGLSAEDAGRRMGRSATAVHSLYRRALEAWQTALADNPGLRGESPRGRRP